MTDHTGRVRVSSEKNHSSRSMKGVISGLLMDKNEWTNEERKQDQTLY